MKAKPPQRFKLAVIGVRDVNRQIYANYDYIARSIEDYVRRHDIPEDFQLITGGGQGTESLVIQWAKNNDVDFLAVPPDVKGFGKEKAFTLRYAQIASNCSAMMIFWNGYTNPMIEAASSAILAGVHVHLVPVT